MNAGRLPTILLFAAGFGDLRNTVTGSDPAAAGPPSRLLCQIAPAPAPETVRKGLARRPSPAAISSIVRPDATDRSSEEGLPTLPGTAASSRYLISIQLVQPRS